MTDYVFAPPSVAAVPVAGGGSFPVRRVFCVGRNYAAHAREMGSDPDRELPFFFCKPADALLTYPYNGQTNLPLGYSPASELPNPLPGVSMTGMPLSVHGSMFSSFLVTRATLFNNTANQAQDLIASDSTGGARSAFVFFPKNVLSAGSSYTFCVDVQVNGKLRQPCSSFTTAPA